MLRKSKILSLLLCFCFLFEQTGFAQVAGALDISGHIAAFRNQLIQDKFRPLHLRSLGYDNNQNNLRILLDKGDLKNPKKPDLEITTKTLLNYFFVGVTLPNDTFWVNLRPDSESNIIDPDLATTDVGKILLEADLQLKKDTAKFTSPETPEGKEYWEKLYQKAGELLGYENITIPTLTRPWIVPGEIIIRETKDNAYIYKATLKVMLEQDYLKDSATYNFDDPRLKTLNEYSSQLIRDLIIPKLTKEINTSQRYAPLRQVYYSLILAQWFKSRFYGKGGLYSWLIDRRSLQGLTSKISWSKTTYFKAYQKSFKDGEYNIQQPVYTPYGQSVRSYFSGGFVCNVPIPAVPAPGIASERTEGPTKVIAISGDAEHNPLPLTESIVGALAVGGNTMDPSETKVTITEEASSPSGLPAGGLQSGASSEIQRPSAGSEIEKNKEIAFSSLKKEDSILTSEIEELKKELIPLADKYKKTLDVIEMVDKKTKDLSQSDDLDKIFEEVSNLILSYQNIPFVIPYLYVNSKEREEKMGQEIGKTFDRLSELRREIRYASDKLLQKRKDLERRQDKIWYRLFNAGTFKERIDVVRMQEEKLSELEGILRKNSHKDGDIKYLTASKVLHVKGDLVGLIDKTLYVFQRKYKNLLTLAHEGISVSDLLDKLQDLENKLNRYRDINDELAKSAYSEKYGIRMKVKAEYELNRFTRKNKIDLITYIADKITFVSKPKLSKEHSEYLKNLLLEIFFSAPYSDTGSVDLDNALLKIAKYNSYLKVELTPYIIMNAWREDEVPPKSLYTFPSNIELYNFISSLTDSELEKLKEIPGLMQVIEAILQGPSSFSSFRLKTPDFLHFEEAFVTKGYLASPDKAYSYDLYKEDRYLRYEFRNYLRIYRQEPDKAKEIMVREHKEGAWISLKEAIEKVCQELGLEPDFIMDYKNEEMVNSVYIKIMQGLTTMGLSMLGDQKKQLFVLELFRRIGRQTDIGGESHERMKEILMQADSFLTSSKALDVLMDIGIYGENPKAKLIIIHNFLNFPYELQEEVRSKAYRIFTSFLGNDNIDQRGIDFLAQILGIGSPEAREVIKFVNALNKITGIKNEIKSKETLQNYLDLSRHSEYILPFIAELLVYGYQFTPNHAKILQELIKERERIIRSILDIRKGYPDFNYQIFYDLSGKDNHITDPYELCINRIGLGKILSANIELLNDPLILKGVGSLLLRKVPRLAEGVDFGEERLDKDIILAKLKNERRFRIPEYFDEYIALLEAYLSQQAPSFQEEKYKIKETQAKSWSYEETEKENIDELLSKERGDRTFSGHLAMHQTKVWELFEAIFTAGYIIPADIFETLNEQNQFQQMLKEGKVAPLIATEFVHFSIDTRIGYLKTPYAFVYPLEMLLENQAFILDPLSVADWAVGGFSANPEHESHKIPIRNAIILVPKSKQEEMDKLLRNLEQAYPGWQRPQRIFYYGGGYAEEGLRQLQEQYNLKQPYEQVTISKTPKVIRKLPEGKFKCDSVRGKAISLLSIKDVSDINGIIKYRDVTHLRRLQEVQDFSGRLEELTEQILSDMTIGEIEVKDTGSSKRGTYQERDSSFPDDFDLMVNVSGTVPNDSKLQEFGRKFADELQNKEWLKVIYGQAEFTVTPESFVSRRDGRSLIKIKVFRGNEKNIPVLLIDVNFFADSRGADGIRYQQKFWENLNKILSTLPEQSREEGRQHILSVIRSLKAIFKNNGVYGWAEGGLRGVGTEQLLLQINGVEDEFGVPKTIPFRTLDDFKKIYSISNALTTLEEAMFKGEKYEGLEGFRKNLPLWDPGSIRPTRLTDRVNEMALRRLIDITTQAVVSSAVEIEKSFFSPGEPKLSERIGNLAQAVADRLSKHSWEDGISNIREFIRRRTIGSWDKEISLRDYAIKIANENNINIADAQDLNWEEFANLVWERVKLKPRQLSEAIILEMNKRGDLINRLSDKLIPEFQKNLPGTIKDDDLPAEDIFDLEEIDEARRIGDSASATYLELSDPDFKDKLARYVELPVQRLVVDVLKLGGKPFMSNAYGPGAKGIWWVKDGTKYFTPLTSKDYLEVEENVKDEPVGPAVSSPISDKKGGIDFRALPNVNQQINMGMLKLSASDLNRLSNINLVSEWTEIQNMVNAGIIPSNERIKEYVLASCLRQNLDNQMDKVLGCIANIMRMEEDRVMDADVELKDILVLIEAGKPETELQCGLSQIKISPQEPKLVVP